MQMFVRVKLFPQHVSIAFAIYENNYRYNSAEYVNCKRQIDMKTCIDILQLFNSVKCMISFCINVFIICGRLETGFSR